jgi:hypothetical protein
LVAYLSITFDTEELNNGESEEQRDNPSAVINILYTCPEFDDLGNVRYDRTWPKFMLTLQAAEISKGSTVSQPIPYCHPQANPQEGSMNLQIYMVKAPFIGYMTAISASACIMRYLITIVSIFSLRTANS